jgi:hypothetical protein
MEVLLNNLRNEITSYQSFIEKFKTREYRALLDKLSGTVDPDPDQRDVIEDKLSRLNDIRIRDRLLYNGIYDTLNSEKMTPHFLKLAKISANTGSLSDIKDDKGDAFTSETLLKKYIFDEYAKIYGVAGTNKTVDDINAFWALKSSIRM